MKKWIVSLVLIVVLLCAATYLFIPSKISVVSASYIGASENSSARYLLDSAKWKQWWTFTDSAGNSLPYQNGFFISNGDTFRLDKLLHMSADIIIKHSTDTTRSRVLLIAQSNDSCVLQWQCSLDAGANPITRFQQYRKAIALKKAIDKVISHFRVFAENPENVYGLKLTRSSINDTLFMSNKVIYNAIPTTPDIYRQVQQLQAYIEKNGGVQSGNPIYNTIKTDATHYQLMVAVPINKVMTGNDLFSFKRMIRGSFIVTDVKGGEQAIENASNSLDLFFSDYSKTSMAMNFRMLITNRLETPDSSQWVTRLYHPVY